MDGEIEIDLRRLFMVLFAGWRWIILFALVPTIICFGYFYLLQPRLYQASAIVSLVQPRYQLNFDPQYQTLEKANLTNKVINDIALSSDIVSQLFEAWSEPRKSPDQFDGFLSHIEVKTGNDTSVAKLIVRLDSAEEAARLANLWAQLVVDKINTVFADLDQGRLTLLESQLSDAKANLIKADQALIAFEAQNQRNSLQNQLNVLVSYQKTLLLQQDLINQWQQETQSLLEELEGIPDSAMVPPDVYTRWTMLTLQPSIFSSVFQSQDINGNFAPYQFQVPIIPGGATSTVAEFRRAVRTWQLILDKRVAFISEQLRPYPSILYPLQERIESLNREKERLTLERKVAADTYETLNNKYQELRITFQIENRYARIASRAYPPYNPVSRGTLTYTLVAFFGGAVLGMTFVLLRDWWLQGKDTESQQ